MQQKRMKLSAVILAAGYSSRIGGFKPLMELGGQSLLARCALLFRQANVDDLYVVSGLRRKEVEAEAIRLGLSCIHNPHYDRGMYSSVLTALPHLSHVDGFFLLPVDIPLIRPATITALSAAFHGQTVVFPCFEDLRGHPPLIPAHHIADLLAYDGDGGLKSFLVKQQGREVAVWDRGIILDADTPEDLDMLARRVNRLTIGEPVEAMTLARLSMPERGVAHGLAVAQVATALGRELNRHGYLLDMDLLHNGALLHDVAKGQPQHEARGAELLKGLGLAKLAEIVAAHRDVPPPASERLTEKEVVCLADKLVRGTLRLSVPRRFAEKLELHAHDREACRAIQGRLTNALALEALVEKVVGRRIEEILASDQDP